MSVSEKLTILNTVKNNLKNSIINQLGVDLTNIPFTDYHKYIRSARKDTSIVDFSYSSNTLTFSIADAEGTVLTNASFILSYTAGGSVTTVESDTGDTGVYSTTIADVTDAYLFFEGDATYNPCIYNYNWDTTNTLLMLSAPVLIADSAEVLFIDCYTTLAGGESVSLVDDAGNVLDTSIICSDGSCVFTYTGGGVSVHAEYINGSNNIESNTLQLGLLLLFDDCTGTDVNEKWYTTQTNNIYVNSSSLGNFLRVNSLISTQWRMPKNFKITFTVFNTDASLYLTESQGVVSSEDNKLITVKPGGGEVK